MPPYFKLLRRKMGVVTPATILRKKFVFKLLHKKGEVDSIYDLDLITTDDDAIIIAGESLAGVSKFASLRLVSIDSSSCLDTQSFADVGLLPRLDCKASSLACKSDCFFPAR